MEDIILLHLWLFSINWATLKNYSVVADLVHHFVTPSSDVYSQQDDAPCHRARIHCTPKVSTINTSPIQQSSAGIWWNGDSHHWGAADELAATVWCYCVKTDQNQWGMFPTPCWIYDTKTSGSSEIKKEVQPFTATPKCYRYTPVNPERCI